MDTGRKPTHVHRAYNFWKVVQETHSRVQKNMYFFLYDLSDPMNRCIRLGNRAQPI